jgi:NADPH:quinone reductase-like Zn-dependent oxidoreductase
MRRPHGVERDLHLRPRAARRPPLFALAFAKLHGAHVTVISSRDEKLDRVRSMGADAAINYAKTEDWARASREITADRGGYDHIVELGGERTLPLSLKAVRPGGTVSVIGVLSGLKMEASLGLVVTRQVRLQGITVGHREGFEAMSDAIGQHGLRPVIGRRFAFEDLHAAMDHLRSGGGMGKTVLEF